MSGSIPITPQGFARLQEELKRIREVERPAMVTELSIAREHGDLRENAEYKAAKESLSMIDTRIETLESNLSRAEVISTRPKSLKRVAFGAYVRIANVETGDEKEYRIVGELESDFDNGLLSVRSPLGAALIGREHGDTVKFRSPAGMRVVELVAVRYE